MSFVARPMRWSRALPTVNCHMVTPCPRLCRFRTLMVTASAASARRLHTSVPSPQTDDPAAQQASTATHSDTRTTATPSSQPRLALRPYQAACVTTSLEAIHAGVTRQSVSLPVGSGKTVIFATLIPQLPARRSGAHRVLVLAHRSELLSQAANTIARVCPHLTVGIEQGKHTADDADVVIGSVPTLGRRGSLRLSKFDPSEFKAIVIDEAHHVTAATYLRVLDYFGCRQPGGDVLLWGCSATLRRHDGVSLGAVFDKVTYHRTMLQMWDEGWLCPARPHRIETGVDLSSVPVSSATHDFSQTKLAAAVNDARRNVLIVEAWKALAHDKGRRSTLVFCVDTEHIRTLQAAFRAQGVEAYAVDGKTPTDERAVILERFREGTIPVLLNCAVYTEGTDIPTTDCIIMARPTKSSVLFQQMLGRGLRLHPGKTDCLVLDLTDNCGRNTVVTVPSLLGLDPNFDVAGETVDVAYTRLKRMVAECPEVVLARSLEQAEDTVSRHRRLAQQTPPVENVHEHVFKGKLKTRQDPTQWRKLSPLPFAKSGAGEYVLDVQDVGTIRVYATFDGQDGSLQYRSDLLTVRSGDDPHMALPLVADSLEAAFAAVQSYLQREFPRAYAGMFDHAIRNPHGPPSPKQTELLRRLIGPNRAARIQTKGQASYLINQILSKQRSDGKARKFAQQRAQREARIDRGLVTKV
eukprot:m.195928 g.195928  ORF g.195928 m.195928 type:complete len:694 (-) comp19657_c0_seq1:157-2238(-)